MTTSPPLREPHDDCDCEGLAHHGPDCKWFEIKLDGVVVVKACNCILTELVAYQDSRYPHQSFGVPLPGGFSLGFQRVNR